MKQRSRIILEDTFKYCRNYITLWFWSSILEVTPSCDYYYSCDTDKNFKLKIQHYAWCVYSFVVNECLFVLASVCHVSQIN